MENVKLMDQMQVLSAKYPFICTDVDCVLRNDIDASKTFIENTEK
jgi:hypothetical protein